MSNFDYLHFSPKKLEKLAQRLLNEIEGLNLEISKLVTDTDFDLVQFDDNKSESIEVAVEVKKIKRYTNKEFQRIVSDVKFAQEKYGLKRFIFISMGLIPPASREFLKVISKSLKNIDFSVLDTEWIDAALNDHPDILADFSIKPLQEKMIRLNQAARKLNVGIDTVVEFLGEQGFKIERSPNAYLNPEQYAILAKEYADSFQEKEVEFTSQQHNKPKHALSIDKNDPILTQKGYHNQGPIGFIYSNKTIDSIPLTQVYINSSEDYFYYLHRKNETFADNDISEEKIIGYVSTDAKGGHIELMRYRRQENNDLDHFYCTQPNQSKIKEFNYERERADFDYKYLLRQPGDNLSKLYVYSNSPGTKLFSSAIITSPYQSEGVKDLIKSNFAHDKSFWWIVNEQSKFGKVDRKISSGFGFTYVNKLKKQPDKGEIVIVVSKNEDYFIQGIFEVTNSAENTVYAKYLYEFQSKTPVSQLHKSNSTNTNELTTSNGVYPISFNLFEEIINSTELGTLEFKTNKLTSYELSDKQGDKRKKENEIVDEFIQTNLEAGGNFSWININEGEVDATKPNQQSIIHINKFLVEDGLVGDNLAICNINISEYNGFGLARLQFQSSTEIEDVYIITVKYLHFFLSSPQLNELIAANIIDENTHGAVQRLEIGVFSDLISALKGLQKNEGSSDIEQPFDPKRTHIHNDGAYTSEDLLNIDNDVRSFALLLASEDVAPPLAIALFGRWGSGKSFFMKYLSQHVEELSKYQRFLTKEERKLDAGQIEKIESLEGNTYVQGIAQIEFNAWSYLDANLWAGLVTSIFEKLNEYITGSTKSGIARLKVQEKLNERLIGFKKLRLSEEQRKEELINLKRSYEIEKKNLESSIRSNFSEKILDLINADPQLQKGQSTISNDAYLSELSVALKIDKLQEDASVFKSFWRNLRQSRFLLKYFISALVSVALALVFFNLEIFELLSKYWLSSVIPFLGTLGVDLRLLKQRYQSIQSYVKRFNKLIEQNSDFRKKIEEHELFIMECENQMTEASSRIEELGETIKDFEQYIINELHQETIQDFIQSRSNHSDYMDKVGIVSIIRKDFETLSELFYESSSTDSNNRENSELKDDASLRKDKELIRNQFRKGKKLERIILYIDDLDRCPDDKVLQVIQAVHLLMAFPLFNVVVGVDQRCVRNALLLKTKLEYRKIAPIDEIEGLGVEMINPGEYLEKIFQIPFELNEATTDEIKDFVHEILSEKKTDVDLPDDNTTHGETNSEEVNFGEISIGDTDTTGEVIQEVISKGDDEIRYKTTDGKEKIVTNVESEIDEKKESDELSSQSDLKHKSLIPEDLEISEDEIKLIKEMIWLVGDIPRTVKRFINIYRIVRANLQLDNEEEYKASMFILAITIGQYKRCSHELFELILKNPGYQLSTSIKKIKKISKEKVNEILDTLNEGNNSDLLKMKGKKLKEKIIPFVRRFSFGNEEEFSSKESETATS